jgi:hypothetical protein
MLKLLIASVACVSAFQAPVSRSSTTQPSISMSMKPMEALGGPAAVVSALAITLHSEAAHAKSVVGVNGGLDFGPLAGDQPGGEGTGKALGINDDSLLFALGGVVLVISLLFAQWQDYQDDDDDFFDTYDSRREDKELTNRNRV